jgi:hypothetical protein
MNSKASFDKGMLIWMQLHRGVYFWMRAIFQIIAFSFLIVTILMLLNYGDNYWHSTLAMLAAKHCLNMLSYTIDLVAFSIQKVEYIRYKLFLDVISVILIVAVQFKLFNVANSIDLLIVDSENFDQVRLWVVMEVSLFYIGLLAQLVFFIVILCKVNSAKFQDDYFFALRGLDHMENNQVYHRYVLK